MSKDILPDDIEQLKALLLKERSEKAVVIRKNEDLRERVEELEDELRLNRQKRFAPKSEKNEFTNEPGLFDEIEEWASEKGSLEKSSKNEKAEETVEVASHKRKKSGRKPLPAHLPRKVLTIELSSEEAKCECGSHEREIIGYEESEELEHIPEQLFVRRYRRAKYGPCKRCKREDLLLEKPLVTAPMRERIMPGSIASPSLLAAILTGKFVDGLPFYRLEKIYARHGLEISRSNMCNWAGRLLDRGLLVINNLLREQLLSARLLGMDETSLQVMKESGRSDSAKSYMWVMRGENVEGGDKTVVCYHYSPNRNTAVAGELLGNYKGTLQSDGYEVYERAIEGRPIVHAGCWAHARRKFMEAIKNSKRAGSGHEFVKMIKELYRVEKDAHRLELAGTALKCYRQKHSGPVLEKIKQKLDKKGLITTPQSLLGKAINYTLGQWDRLKLYIDHPEAHIDNNLVENAIRPFVVGRKNWLFSGSPKGAHAGAAIYSLIETAKANNLEPYWYLRYLFEQLPQARASDSLEKLLPTEVTIDMLDSYFNKK